MNTKLLLGASAVLMALAGFGGTFAPGEFLDALHLPDAGILPLLIQLLAALLLAFAMTNWMAKESRIGGIYNRPLAIGNLLHFTIGAITLCKYVVSHDAPMYVFIAAVLYVIFALSFAKITFMASRTVEAPPRSDPPSPP